MSNLVTEQTFLKEVVEHRMTVLLDNGVHRHLRFANPRSSNMSFELVTWPGYLAYVGDMGSYVFSRITDMFQFFRTPESYRLGRDGSVLAINPCYWGEKLQAHDHVDGYKEYSADLFREVIKEWLEDHELNSPELLQAVEDEVLRYADEGEHDARRAVDQFKHGDFQFYDFWEAKLQTYTGRYLWCCYALTWGIAQYDAHKAAQEAA